MKQQSKTNATTQGILDFLLDRYIIAYRNNTLPIPITKNGVHVGFRPAPKSGRPDIEGIIPPHGRALLVEVKTGKDKLSEIQEAHLQQAAKQGALVLVVKDLDDFVCQWEKLSTPAPLIPEL